jgi:hypothetical protein
MKKYQLVVLDKDNKMQYGIEDDTVAGACRNIIRGIVDQNTAVDPQNLDSVLGAIIEQLSSIRDGCRNGQLKSRLIERNCTTF